MRAGHPRLPSDTSVVASMTAPRTDANTQLRKLLKQQKRVPSLARKKSPAAVTEQYPKHCIRCGERCTIEAGRVEYATYGGPRVAHIDCYIGLGV